MKTSELRKTGSSSRGPSSFLLLGLDLFDDEAQEQCGVLVGYEEEDFMRICLVKNRAKYPREEYDMCVGADELDLLSGEYVAGFIHTHLDHHPARPSSNDKFGASFNPELIHIVYKPSTGEVFQYGSDWSERVT